MAVRSRGRERTNVIIEVGGYPGKEGVRSRGENRVGVDPGAVEGVDRASNTSNGRGSRTGDLDLRSRPRTGEFTFFSGDVWQLQLFRQIPSPRAEISPEVFFDPLPVQLRPLRGHPAGKSVHISRSIALEQTDVTAGGQKINSVQTSVGVKTVSCLKNQRNDYRCLKTWLIQKANLVKLVNIIFHFKPKETKCCCSSCCCRRSGKNRPNRNERSKKV